MTAGNIAAWIGILSTFAVGVARINTLEIAKDTQVTWTAQLSETTRRQEERIQAIERNNLMLERVHTLELRLRVLEVEAAQQEAKGRRAR